VTNQEVGEQDWHYDQESDEEDVWCWVVEEISMVDNVLIINFSSYLEQYLGYCMSWRSKCDQSTWRIVTL